MTPERPATVKPGPPHHPGMSRKAVSIYALRNSHALQEDQAIAARLARSADCFIQFAHRGHSGGDEQGFSSRSGTPDKVPGNGETGFFFMTGSVRAGTACRIQAKGIRHGCAATFVAHGAVGGSSPRRPGSRLHYPDPSRLPLVLDCDSPQPRDLGACRT
jgi:hypothetical protein